MEEKLLKVSEEKGRLLAMQDLLNWVNDTKTWHLSWFLGEGRIHHEDTMAVSEKLLMEFIQQQINKYGSRKIEVRDDSDD